MTTQTKRPNGKNDPRRILSSVAHLDMCECGCSRVDHYGIARFTWSHFAKEPK